MIAFGRIVNSFSGALNFATTLGIYSLNLLNISSTTNDLNLAWQAVNTYNTGTQDATTLATARQTVATILSEVLSK